MSPAVVDLSDEVFEALQHAERWCSLGDICTLLASAGPPLSEIWQALETLEKLRQIERRERGGSSNVLLLQWRAIFEGH